jgi:ATP-dependent helicase YprA (DUF1998 family)
VRTEIEHMREALASYIEATYHLSDPKVVALRRKLLTDHGVAQTPFIESTPSYAGHRKYADLSLPKGVSAFLTDLAEKSEDLLFNPPYEHQAEALEHTTHSDAAGSGIVVTTGTGSGKTESFLLPVLARLADEALNRKAHFGTRAVRALLLYPMNALVNDQLGRLRNLFGAPSVRRAFKSASGRPAKFGRYTGRTLYPGFRSANRDRDRLKTLGYYLKLEDAARAGSTKDQELVETLRAKGRWPGKPDSFIGAYDGLRNWYGNSGQHWEDANGHPARAIEQLDDPELLTRHEIQEACPDLLVTNYSMLEYMLLRPLEREIFGETRTYFEAHPEEKFLLILDEAHLYRGANGTEVAYLIRRLLDRLGLSTSRVIFIATSASFSNDERAKEFVAGLCGLESKAIRRLIGSKHAVDVAGAGSADLAHQLANVPLDALHSPDLRERSGVVAPLAAERSDLSGSRVTLKRIDSGPEAVSVAVGGLDLHGRRLEEVVVVEAKGEARSQEPFLIVDTVSCPQGRISVARRYPLGEADAEGFRNAADDLPAALYEILAPLPVVGRLRNITSGAENPADPVNVPGAAWAVTELPGALFTDTENGVSATDALLELASLAKPAPDKPPLLPARVHMLFRGLPGLWACANPDCDQIDAAYRGGPTGKLYSEPRRICGCGSQVLELHSCRSCGLSVARANIGAPAGTDHLWQDNGYAYAGDTGLIEPVHVCLEDPKPQVAGAVRPVYLDLATGKIDGGGTFVREVWLAPLLDPKLFEKCPRCGANCDPSSSNGISDLQTKGEQPFQELISVQVLEQPPRPDSDTPLQGRKALVFSDGRQTASRLAGTLKTFSFRDSLRPLLLAGMTALKQPAFTPSLDDAPLAIALGGARHGVRLRPIGAEDGRLDRAGRRAVVLIGSPDADAEDFRQLTNQTSAETPRSVFQSLYAVLQDEHTGIFPLALATLKAKLTKIEADKVNEAVVLPTIPGLNDEEARAALIELWLWQALRKHAIRLRDTPDNVETGRGSSGIRAWNGKFSKKFTTLLEARGLKQWLKGDFASSVGPALRDVFSPNVTGDFYVQGAKVALELNPATQWIRCERCTTVSPRNALIGNRCTSCTGNAHPIDPEHDPVFRSRKAFFRRLWERLIDPADGYAPHQLIAEEHSAALNDSGMANAMSRNEAYELRFQDIPIEQDGQVGAPIDILSCTTTMEVGIDIGGLTAVALRNVPPGRANYQQRAGRAGRRGAGLSTVIMFCGADSHDQTYYRDPAPIVAGPAPDPILNLDNVVIAKRQAFGFLIGRFQQDRIDDVSSASDVFSSLGSVSDFVNGAEDNFSLAGLRAWLSLNQESLAGDIERLFTQSCPALDPKGVLNDLPRVLEEALIKSDEEIPAEPVPAAVEGEDYGDEILEDGSEEDVPPVKDGRLLDRLFAEGLLPKYAFPTDVAAFSVFEDDTDPWRPKRRYSPQQALNAALSQYAPGHEVWVDGKRFLSLGIYAERDSDRLDAYRARKLYYQCRVCNYADLLDWSDGYVDQTRDCPACSGRATLGPARRWVRPPGFSHPPTITALPPDFDAGMRLRPTKATLDSMTFTPGSRIGGATWPLGTSWEAWSESKNLVVTNRGSLDAANPAFNYCTQCGRIEPANFDPTMRQLFGKQPHDRPRPRRPKEPEQCTGSALKIVLGNEFRTDVAVFRLGLPAGWRFDPDRPSTVIAARSAVEALRRAACQLEDLEPNDIDGDFRFAPASCDQQFIDLYLYDQAAGGAGFVKAASKDPSRLVKRAIELLDDCTCDDSCYQCLRSYKNRFDHAMFDRFIGGDLLKACFAGQPLSIAAKREDEALDRLGRDLLESDAKFTRVDGGLVEEDGRIICLSHPFIDGEPCSPRARALANGHVVAAVDILMVLRALPIATNIALVGPVTTSVNTLALDPNGTPELDASMVIAGNLAGDSGTQKYAVAGAETNDLLFRVKGNMLSGKNGDGQGNAVSSDALCLFRPLSDAPGKTEICLLRRTDGKAFGSTSAEWTVGILQPAGTDGTRIRYRAASQHMECVSELVVPATAVEVLARFVKVID